MCLAYQPQRAFKFLFFVGNLCFQSVQFARYRWHLSWRFVPLHILFPFFWYHRTTCTDNARSFSFWLLYMFVAQRVQTLRRCRPCVHICNCRHFSIRLRCPKGSFFASVHPIHIWQVYKSIQSELTIFICIHRNKRFVSCQERRRCMLRNICIVPKLTRCNISSKSIMTECLPQPNLWNMCINTKSRRSTLMLDLKIFLCHKFLLLLYSKQDLFSHRWKS